MPLFLPMQIVGFPMRQLIHPVHIILCISIHSDSKSCISLQACMPRIIVQHCLDSIWRFNLTKLYFKISLIQFNIQLFYNLVHWQEPGQIKNKPFIINFPIKAHFKINGLRSKDFESNEGRAYFLQVGKSMQIS